MAPDNVVGGELDVLGEQVVLPAVVLPDGLGGHQEAGAGDGAAGVQLHPGAVQEPGLPQNHRA